MEYDDAISKAADYLSAAENSAAFALVLADGTRIYVQDQAKTVSNTRTALADDTFAIAGGDWTIGGEGQQHPNKLVLNRAAIVAVVERAS
jgi:hypothetical protein